MTWTCADQQAFQVRMGGHDSGTVFGTVKSYQCPTYLPDGEKLVQVRCQNGLGLWSAWKEERIAVANVPGTAVTLLVTATHHARLAWTNRGLECSVLRDGVPVARSGSASYTDEFTVGRHTYQIREPLAGDNYTLSNAVTTVIRPAHATITAVSPVAWQTLRYSLEQSPTVGESVEQDVSMVHYVGRSLPVAEFTGFEDRSVSFTTAFRIQDAWLDFEGLIGKVVCYKNPQGRCIVGTLTAFASRTGKYYAEYSCTISAIDWQEGEAYE